MANRAIGIAGGSCSGKSTLAHAVRDSLGEERCLILPQDDYFYGLSDAPEGKGGKNFDHPDAVDFDRLCADLAALKAGEAVERPQYDFTIHYPKAETVPTEPRPIILVDGILILCWPPLRELLDGSVFVRCDAETRLARRLKRDVESRGREREEILRQFGDQVEPMHQRFVEPSAAYADIVLEQGDIIDFLESLEFESLIAG